MISFIRIQWDLAGKQFYYVALGVCLAGFFLAVLSIPIGIGFVTLDGQVLPLGDQAGSIKHVFPPGIGAGFTKEVGYLAAVDWSIYGTILLPMIVALCLRLRAMMRTTLEDMANKKLIRTADGRPVSSAEVIQRWDQGQRGQIIFTLLVGILVFTYLLGDWWQVVGGPLLGWSNLVGVPITDSVMEYDWSIAPLFASLDVSWAAVLAFGIVAYVVIAGCGSVLAFGTFFNAIHFVVMGAGIVTPRDQPKWQLSAIPQAGDRLCGFSVFAPFFSTLIAAALVIIFSVLLLMLQNRYLRDTSSQNIVEFLFGQGVDGVNRLLDSNLRTFRETFLLWLLEPGFNLFSNPQIGIGLLIYAFVFVVCVAATWGMLRLAAHDAQKWSLDNAAILANETGRAEAVIVSDLKAMEFWPIGWISLNNLLLVLLFMMAAIFSYRLLLLAAAWLMVTALTSVLEMITKLYRRRS